MRLQRKLLCWLLQRVPQALHLQGAAQLVPRLLPLSKQQKHPQPSEQGQEQEQEQEQRQVQRQAQKLWALLREREQQQWPRRIQRPLWQASRRNHASIGRYCFSIHRHWRYANCGFLGRRPSLLKRMHQGQWLFCSNWLSQYFPFRDQSSVAAGL